MGRFLTLIVVVVVAFAASYWYRTVYSVCPVPIAYSIGSIDSRFGLSKDDARQVVSDAESLWEAATGRNLFTYDERADFVINFIYDERQQVTYEERILRTELDKKQDINEEIRTEYEALVAEYEKLDAVYEARAVAYEQKLREHNEEVEMWNERGGAPEEEYELLNNRQRQLSEERKYLNRTAHELNELVLSINALGKTGNEIVTEYNEDVIRYNDRFDHDREFTQGDYRGDHINIYQFDDMDELRLVLSHEFGHAMSLEHVDDSRSVMYHLMEGQLADLSLSEYDLEEFVRVCGAH